MRTTIAILVLLSCVSVMRSEETGTPTAAVHEVKPIAAEAVSAIPEAEAVSAIPEAEAESQNNHPTTAPELSSPPSDPQSAPVAGELETAKIKPKGKFGPGIPRENAGELQELRSMGFPMGRYLLSLVVVFGMIGGSLYLLKKLSGRLGLQESSAGNLRVYKRLALDSKNSLVLVRVHEAELLLAVGANGVNLLSRFSQIDDEMIEEAVNDATHPIVSEELQSNFFRGLQTVEKPKGTGEDRNS